MLPQPSGVGITSVPKPDEKTGPVYKRLVREFIYEGRLFASGFFFSVLLQVLLIGWLGPQMGSFTWCIVAAVTTAAALTWWSLWYRKSWQFDREYVTVITLATSRIQLKKFNRFTRIWTNRTFATALLVMYGQLVVVTLVINQSRFLDVLLPRNPHLSSKDGGTIVINLSKRDLSNAQLRGANLRGAVLDGANLNYCNLEYAALEGASMRGTSLVGANLKFANVVDTEFFGADLQNADFRGAKGLTNEQLKSAVHAESIHSDR